MGTTDQTPAPVRDNPTQQQPAERFDYTKAFNDAYSVRPNDSTTTKPNELKEGWQKGDENATNLFKGMSGEFAAFDTADAQVRAAQGQGQPPAFTDSAGPTPGSTKRTYSNPALAGYEHTFNSNGSTDLKVPESAGLGFKSVNFQGDNATVTMPDGSTRAATPEELTKLNDTFKKANGEFSMPGQTEKGKWSLDARGNTNVEQVPGMQPGSTMSIKPPASSDDPRNVRYHAEVKGRDGNPGWSTEVTGNNQNGYRFVDYDDSKASAKEPKTANGRSIEGFVARRQDKPDVPPLTYTSNRPGGDGSVTNIRSSDMSTDTTITPSRENGFQSREVNYPPGHPSGLVSEKQFDPKQNPDGIKYDVQKANGIRTQQRETKDGRFEVKSSLNGEEVVTSYKNEGDYRANPNNAQWSRQTAADGTVTTRYPEGHPSGVAATIFKPGQPGQPGTMQFFEKSDKPGELKPITDENKLKTLLANPPAVATENMGDGRTRTTMPDGKTITTDGKTTVTETANRRETSWNPPPDKDTLAKMTGLSKDDPRLNGVSSISEGTGSDAGRLRLNYNPPREGGQTYTEIRRDASGKEIGESRDGVKKGENGQPDRRYTESVDKTTTPPTWSREYEKKQGQAQGDMEVREGGPEGKLKYSRTAEGNKVTTVDAVRNRTEVRDYDKNTWSITENGQTTNGTMRMVDGQRQLVDSNGRVAGIEFFQGKHKGESMMFNRNPDGSLKSMDITMPGRDGQPGQRVTVEKGDKGWKVNPPGTKEIPGFDKAVVEADGTIKGEFKVNDKGATSFESADKQIKQVLRPNGGRDTYDMKDYSRVREDADGKAGPTQYWDGYGSKDNPDDGWRTGTKRELPDGRTEVTFNPPVDGHPSKMIRDGRADANAPGGFRNGFEVEFPNGTKFSIGNWNEGKMSRTVGGKTDTIYNTGARSNNGDLIWARGSEQGGKVVYDDPRVATGEIPKEATIDKNTGQIDSTYADGTKVTSDARGQRRRIQPGHRGSEAIEPRYGPNGELTGFKQGNRDITKGPDGPDGNSEWTIKQNGQEKKIQGKLVEKPGGKFEIVGPNGKYESNGRLTTKEDGKDTVYDARGQKWQMTNPGDANAKPPVKPTWQMGDRPPLQGDLKMYENGNVGVQNGDNTTMYNPDGSTSIIDKNGIERERNNKDGTYLKRDDVGALTEFKSANGDVTTLSYADLGGGKRGLTKVETKRGNEVIRTEKPVGDKLRVVKTENGKEVAGNEVGYDRMGNRTETAVDGNKSTTTVTDLQGKTRTVKSENGRIVEAPDTAPGAAPDAKFNFKYGADPNDKTPAAIHRGNDTKPYATRVGGANSNIYDVNGVQHQLDATGQLKPVNDNSGLDPCYTVHREARPEQPGGRGDTRPPATTEAELNQKYGLDQKTVPMLKDFAKGLGLPEQLTSPQNLDRFLNAAQKNNMLQLLTPENLARMGQDVQKMLTGQNADQIKQAIGGLMQGLMQNPQAVLQQLSNPEALNQIRGMLPDSLKPFVNPQFLADMVQAPGNQPVSPAPTIREQPRRVTRARGR